jgi:hypothetical protein
VDNLVIERSYSVLCSSKSQPKSITDDAPAIVYKGASFLFRNKRVWNVSGTKDVRAKWHNQQWQKQIEFFLNAIMPVIGDDKIQLMTECKRQGIIFRGHPSYQGNVWQDWAFIDWGRDGGLVPAHLLIFVDLTNLTGPIKVNGVTADVPGMYAVAHTLPKSLDIETDPVHVASILLCKGAKQTIQQRRNNPTTGRSEVNTFPALVLVNCDAIHSPCIALPMNALDINVQIDYMFLLTRDKWRKCLLDQISKIVQ